MELPSHEVTNPSITTPCCPAKIIAIKKNLNKIKIKKNGELVVKEILR